MVRVSQGGLVARVSQGGLVVRVSQGGLVAKSPSAFTSLVLALAIRYGGLVVRADWDRSSA